MTHCVRCGGPLADADHSDCATHLQLEPPRYCAQCGRRMVVQITPTTWTARCARHGTITASTT